MIDYEAPPPIGKSWKRLYAVVIINLVIMIVIFYAFTKAFE